MLPCVLTQTLTIVLHFQFKEPLDRRFKLPRLTYKGDEPRPQWIQDRSKKPDIQEVSSTEAKGKKAVPKASLPTAFMSHVLLCNYGDGSPDKGIATSPAVEGGAVPFLVAGQDTDAPSELIMQIDFSNQCPDFDQITVELAQELVVVKAPGYHALELFLPYPVDESQCKAAFEQVSTKLVVTMVVNRDPWTADSADLGSNAWMLATALNDGDTRVTEKKQNETVEVQQSADSDELPEDRFHLKLPKNVDQHTGIPNEPKGEPVEDDEPLPEDRFHQKDLQSQQILGQKKQEKVDKQKKADEERSQRREEAGLPTEDDEDVMTVEESSIGPDGKEVVKLVTYESDASKARKAARERQKRVDDERTAEEQAHRHAISTAADAAAEQWAVKQNVSASLPLKSRSLAFELLD
jgi:hypothetical protein